MFRIVVKAKALDVGPILQFMAERNILVEQCQLEKQAPPKQPKELTSVSNGERKPSSRTKGKTVAAEITRYVQALPPNSQVDLSELRAMSDRRGHSKNAAYQALPGLVAAGVLNKVGNGTYFTPNITEKPLPSLKPEFQP